MPVARYNVSGMTVLPRPGAIHQLTEIRVLANGGVHRSEINACILDAAEDGEGGARILWRPMSIHEPDPVPSGPAVESTFERHRNYPTVSWAHSITSTESADRPWRISLGPQVGTFKTRDASIAVLADFARKEVRRVEKDRLTEYNLREDLRRIASVCRSIPERRDELIRSALAAGASVAHLADDSGLSESRIYQIRDGRR